MRSHGLGGSFTIRATNSRLYGMTFPASLTLNAGETSNGTVTILASGNIESGTDVTLTIEVEAPGGQDANYAVLRFSVINTVTRRRRQIVAGCSACINGHHTPQVSDATAPTCQLISLNSNCPQDCNSARWTLSVRVVDEDGGTGVANVTLKSGNGTLEVGYGAITLVSYNASCCASKVELLVVDQAGNTGTCLYSLSNRIAPSPLLCLITAVLGILIKR